MQTIQVIPKVIGTGVTKYGDRTVGVLRMACTGQLADVGLDILLTPVDLGNLEAQISQLRDNMRMTSADA